LSAGIISRSVATAGGRRYGSIKLIALETKVLQAGDRVEERPGDGLLAARFVRNNLMLEFEAIILLYSKQPEAQ